MNARRFIIFLAMTAVSWKAVDKIGQINGALWLLVAFLAPIVTTMIYGIIETLNEEPEYIPMPRREDIIDVDFIEMKEG